MAHERPRKPPPPGFETSDAQQALPFGHICQPGEDTAASVALMDALKVSGDGEQGDQAERQSAEPQQHPQKIKKSPAERKGAHRVGRGKNGEPLEQEEAYKPTRSGVAAGVERLTQDIETFVSNVMATEEERRQAQEAARRIGEIAAQQWPRAAVQIYGSLASGMAVRGSVDVDLSVDVSGQEEDKGGIVQRLGELCEEEGHKDVTKLPFARVPVCKLRCASSLSPPFWAPASIHAGKVKVGRGVPAHRAGRGRRE